MARRRIPVRLFNAARRAAERFGWRALRFAASEEALLAAARRATGHDDFGDGGFREGLSVLLRAYDEEARLTPFGRWMVWQQLQGLLQARLGIEAARGRVPSLRQGELRRPIFIVGLPRTGTTALHQLLAQDPGQQVLDYWLATAPGPRPVGVDPRRDPRFKRAEQGLRLTYYLDPGLKAIHHLSAEGPDECRHLLGLCFSDDTFDSNASIPSYSAWYARRDMRSAYAYHRQVLALIQSTCPDRRWVLKYPAHLRHLEVLLQVYPDAYIVQTHRDPVRVLPSLISLLTNWRGIYEDEVDVPAVARWQLEMWAERLEHAMAVRESVDPARFVDLDFREVVADPLAAVRRIYDRFDLELGSEAEQRMRVWSRENPQGHHGGHRYSAGQFGLQEGAVAERFAAYAEHFGVEREAPGTV